MRLHRRASAVNAIFVSTSNSASIGAAFAAYSAWLATASDAIAAPALLMRDAGTGVQLIVSIVALASSSTAARSLVDKSTSSLAAVMSSAAANLTTTIAANHMPYYEFQLTIPQSTSLAGCVCVLMIVCFVFVFVFMVCVFNFSLFLSFYDRSYFRISKRLCSD